MVQKRKADRVRFELGYPARIMAIDGTWYRDCIIEDVSQTGAQLSFADSIEGLTLSEFFLALSRTGPAHRRCRMIWLNGNTVGAVFDVAKEPTDSKDKRAARRDSQRQSRGEPQAG
jgi:hypothetical protein